MKRTQLILATCFVAQIAFSQHGTSPNWTTPVAIDKPTGMSSVTKGGIGQNIVRLSNGDLVQCFTNEVMVTGGTPTIYLARSEDDGLSWSEVVNYAPTALTPAPNTATIAKDTSDNIHMIWETNNPINRIYYSKMDKDFNVLIDTVRVTQYTVHNDLNSVYLTTDRSGGVHVMWHDGDNHQTSDSSYFAQVMYCGSLDGGVNWGGQILLSDTTIHTHAAFPRANFSGSSGDVIAIPWRQEDSGGNWDVWVAYSTDHGLTWTEYPEATTVDVEWDPGIVVDKNDRIHLHYHEYQDVNPTMSKMEYAYSDDLGVTWNPQDPFVTISPSGIRSQLSIFAYDYETDIQCICWKDERDFVSPIQTLADMMCSFSEDGGVTWQGQEFVTDLDTIAVGFKSVEVGSNGALYATYEWKDSTGNKTIWLSKRPILHIGLDEKAHTENVKVFPNPTDKYLQIDGINVSEFKIYDMHGKLMRSFVEADYLFVGDLPAGAYMLVIQTENDVYRKQVMIR